MQKISSTFLNKSLVILFLLYCSFSFCQEVTKPLKGKVALDKLPKNVNDFVNKNYKGYKLVKAAYDPLCKGGNAIDVSISKKNSPKYSLIFLLDGTFVQQEEDIHYAIAPKKVQESIEMNYSKYSYSKQLERLKLADNTVQYLVDIKKEGKDKEVILNSDGVLVCEN